MGGISEVRTSIKPYRKHLKGFFNGICTFVFPFPELDPEKIDVNIHPQKTEVKFEDEHLIFALLRSTIKRSLGIYNVSPSLDFDRDPELDEMMNKPIPSKGNGGGSGGGVLKCLKLL